MQKKLTVLGCTGSIGVQTLSVARDIGCTIFALAAQKNIEVLEAQAREFSPRFVAIGDSSLYRPLKDALQDTDVTVLAGEACIAELAAMPVDCVLNAVVGIAGLPFTLAAIDAGNTLALANKESLVTAGELVMQRAKEKGVPILPVDSEHSAIFQCLQGEGHHAIHRILLTASGGPFFQKTKAELASVTAEQALCHPNWSMGPKITIDSATLMNKGLELIEAMHLFSVTPDQIEVIIHRQSIVHSAVEFCDGAVIAQLGTPDMKLPIQYAITYPDRLPCGTNRLSLTEIAQLTFASPDYATFGCLFAAIKAAKLGGLYPCAVNGANEAAVALFLQGEIGFNDISQLVNGVLRFVQQTGQYSLEEVRRTDLLAREYVLSQVKGVNL